MTIRLESGSILIDGAGDIALSGDCCCDACECTLQAPFANCQCLSSDFATPTTQADLTVTISGTGVPFDLIDGGLSCDAPSTCDTVTGTYVVSCDDDTTWCIASLACEDTDGRDWYYLTSVRIYYTAISAPLITVQIRAGFTYNTPGTGNPYPSLTSTGCTPPSSNFGATRTLSRQFNDTFTTWFYELGGTCTTACNSTTTRSACINSGSYSWDSDIYSDAGGDPVACGIEGLTVTLSK